MRKRIRGPQTALAACALALAVLGRLAAGRRLGGRLPLRAAASWSPPCCSPGRRPCWTAVAGFLVFLGLVALDGRLELYPTVLTLAAVCALALVLALRHRPAPGVQQALPRFTPAAGMLGHVAADLAASLDLHQLLGSMAQQLTAARRRVALRHPAGRGRPSAPRRLDRRGAHRAVRRRPRARERLAARPARAAGDDARRPRASTPPSSSSSVPARCSSCRSSRRASCSASPCSTSPAARPTSTSSASGWGRRSPASPPS